MPRPQNDMIDYFIPCTCVRNNKQISIGVIESNARVQCSPYKTGAIEIKHCSKVFLAQVLVVDHTPLTIMTNYDEARLWIIKNPIP